MRGGPLNGYPPAMIEVDSKPGYVLPFRCEHDEDLAELTAYLSRLSRHAEVVVVDGSAQPWFDRHARAWGHFVEHCRPDPDLRCANGKVAGVRTGLRRIDRKSVV